LLHIIIKPNLYQDSGALWAEMGCDLVGGVPYNDTKCLSDRRNGFL